MPERPDPKPGRILLTRQDLLLEVENLRKQVRELRGGVEARSMLNSIDDLVFVIDTGGRFTRYYQGSEREDLYADPTSFLGRHVRDVLPRQVAEQMMDTINQVQLFRQPRELEYALAIQGKRQWFGARISPLNDESGELRGTVVVVRNVTERRHREEANRYAALHDSLTGLPNRVLFRDRLKTALAQACPPLALLMFDLDQFKQINDTFGHYGGDRFLEEIGRRLRTLCRKTDTVARVGGDEFMVLLPEINRKENAFRVAQKILDTINKPFVLSSSILRSGASIGIAFFPEDGVGEEALLKNADLAMYRAKADGNRYQSYSRPDHDLRDTAS